MGILSAVIDAVIDFVGGLAEDIASAVADAMSFVEEWVGGLRAAGEAAEEVAGLVDEAVEIVDEAIEWVDRATGGGWEAVEMGAEVEIRELEEEIENEWDALEELAQEMEEIEWEEREEERIEEEWGEIEQIAREEGVSEDTVLFAMQFACDEASEDWEYRGTFSLSGAVAYIEDLPQSLWHLVRLVRVGTGLWEVWVAPSF